MVVNYGGSIGIPTLKLLIKQWYEIANATDNLALHKSIRRYPIILYIETYYYVIRTHYSEMLVLP